MLVVLSCCFGIANAQQPDPLSFFPHQFGNIWEYTGVTPPYYVWQERILQDSLGSDGRYYIRHSYYGRLIVDTVAKTVLQHNLTGDTAVLYRLEARQGERWVVFRYNPRSVRIATIRAEFSTILFGSIIEVKMIEYTDSASGLLILTEYIARGFGIIGQDIDGFPDGRISGAIINGKRYGNITLDIQERPASVAQFLDLLQNYPNPFNPFTIITYQLGRSCNIEMNVFDLLGRKVMNLLTGNQMAGLHKINFDGTNLPSGVCVYSLKTPDGIISKRMLLLK
jgi:hypothetical protein